MFQFVVKQSSAKYCFGRSHCHENGTSQCVRVFFDMLAVCFTKYGVLFILEFWFVNYFGVESGAVFQRLDLSVAPFAA